MTPARDQQIRALYRAALERPPAERSSFVAQLTGDDQDLRRSVELLLSSDGATDVGTRVAAQAEAAVELPAGTSIAHYRIDGVLGRGGMGVVYRATDTKLHRPVAIKFLSSTVADADVRRRFKQEAETTSSLNHPHIVTVYDVGEHDGQQYIVSELVDGGTLDDWSTAARKRSWRQSVELVTGVADALAAAHAAGVLHRDVKPGNILIGSNGYAKLADFGLAKLVDIGTQDPRERQASRNTRAGVVVGTIAYMSPEQASGHPLDARSDVFSFGIVLYELIAGRRPFESANELEVLKAIAHATPAPLTGDIPELLRMAVDKALEKEPGDRYQTMQDFVADLKRVARKPGSQMASSSIEVGRRKSTSWIAAGAGVALGAALVFTAMQMLRAPVPVEPPMRFAIPAPGYQNGGLAISPDGQRISYASNANGTRQIWLRPIGALAARPLPGTDNAVGAFWSPDGRSLAFAADGKLKKIDIGGGPAQTIGEPAPGMRMAGSWSPGGTILFPTQVTDFGRVAAAGGKVTAAVPPEEGSRGVIFRGLAHVLPDGDHFVYISFRPAIRTGTTLYVSALSKPTSVPLIDIETRTPPASVTANIAYANGFLLFLFDGTLLARPFDADALALRGDAVPVAENVAEFAVSATGVLVYREIDGVAASGSGAPTPPRRLVWLDRHGQRVGEIETPPVYRLPALSPDGQRVALSVGSPDGLPDIWTIDTARGVTARLTFNAADDDVAVWSPDGTRIVFSSGSNAAPDTPSVLYRRATNGAGSDELLFAGEADELLIPFDWSQDGLILFGRSRLATWRERMDIWVLQTSGEKTASPLLESPFRKASARLSPNGKWIAYRTNESSQAQIQVEPFPNVGEGKWQVSTRGGDEPRWRADGRELFFLAPDGNIMAADVDTGGEVFQSGSPHVLFSTGMVIPGPDEQPDILYDATPDGQRFLINEPVPVRAPASQDASPAAPEPPLNVVINWSAGLTQK